MNGGNRDRSSGPLVKALGASGGVVRNTAHAEPPGDAAQPGSTPPE